MNVINREVVYDGYSKVESITLEHPETGKQFSRELLRRGSSVTLLLFDATNQLFLTTSEFRIGESHLRSRSFGLIAGMIEDGLNEIETAVKEAYEESGIKIENHSIKSLGKTFVSPGITDEQSYLCYANIDLTNVDTNKLYGCDSENEEIQIQVRTLDKLEEFLSQNDLSTSAFTLLFMLKQKALP
jgi:ADP-ribose pyrophosphatase